MLPKVNRNAIITSKCDNRKWLVESVSEVNTDHYRGIEYLVELMLDPPTFRTMGWYISEDELIKNFNI